MYDKVSTSISTFTPPSVDPNVVAVADMLWNRMHKGYLKYGTDTTREDLTTLNWLQHLQEELLDAAVYIQVLKERHVNT